MKFYWKKFDQIERKNYHDYFFERGFLIIKVYKEDSLIWDVSENIYSGVIIM